MHQTPTRVIIDPSALFEPETLEWLADEELRPWLAVSASLYELLGDEGGERFLPYGVDPDPEQTRRVRDALEPILKFSHLDAEEELGEEGRAVRDRLLSSDEPLPEVLADEWVFVTNQSIAVLLDRAKTTLDAFRRAGAEVYEVTRDQMESGLEAIRDRIPPRMLTVMKAIPKWPRSQRVKFLVFGAGIAGLLISPLGLPLNVAQAVQQGIGLIAGDP